MGTMARRWVAAKVGVCEICAALDGKLIAMDESYDIPGMELFEGMHQTPPAHPRCRCAVEYVEVKPETTGSESPKNTIDNGGGSGIIEVDLVGDLNRRQRNIGEFSEIELPMQKREVERIAKKYGVSLEGISIKIQRGPNLLRTPLCGSVDYDNIGRIDLYPNAFKSESELIKTMIHEKCHVKQLQKHGKEYAQENLALMEAQAERFEKLYYKALTRRVNNG